MVEDKTFSERRLPFPEAGPRSLERIISSSPEETRELAARGNWDTDHREIKKRLSERGIPIPTAEDGKSVLRMEMSFSFLTIRQLLLT